MKKTIFFLALLLSSLGAFAWDFYANAPSGQRLYYNIVNGNVEVTSENSDFPYYSIYAPTGSLEIPSTVTYHDNTYSVTSIGNHAFQSCNNLTSVTIPNSVTSIGEGAFSQCARLTDVDIPNSVVHIDEEAFNSCIRLTSVTLGNSVSSIGSLAFAGCRDLTSVIIPASVTYVGSLVFSGCLSLSSIIVDANNTTYDSRDNCNGIIEISNNALVVGCNATTIPNSVTSIGNYAFQGCSSLTSITIPGSVTSIGEGAFSQCSGLTSLTIPNSVTNIGVGAFNLCRGLTSLTIGNSVTSIGSSAFNGCRSLQSMNVYADQVPTLGTSVFTNVPTDIPVTIWPYSASRVTEYQTAGWPFTNYICPGYYLFYALDDESGTATVYVSSDPEDPNRVKIVHVGLLADLNILSSVEYNERTYSVTAIGDFAFYSVDNLSSVTIPNSVTSIGNYAFIECDGLSSITIPNSVTSIGEGAFYNCNSLSSVTIPNSVTSIENNTFSDCVGLTNVTIGESVTSIGEDAFAFCRSLTSVTIPNSVTSIGAAAFEVCSGLSSVTIGESVSSIGGYAFLNCSGLTSVVIPNSVETIGDYAFYNCGNIESVVIGRSVNSIGEYSFEDTYSLKTVYNLSGTEIGINNFGLDANRIVTGIVAMGSGKNVLYKIPESYSIVMTETDQVDNNIPESSLPTNFIAKKNGNWFAKDIVLTDGVDAFNAPVDFTAENVTYTRSYEQGNRSTICLPFKPTTVNGQPTTNLKFYAFANFDGSTITFDEVLFANLQANTPYMVEWPESKVAQNFVFGATNATIPATNSNEAVANRTVTNGNGSFIGTMTRECMNSSNYGYKNGYFVQSAEGNDASDHTSHAHVNPFRAYFEITPSSPEQGFSMPTELSVRFNTAEDNVGIDSVEPQQSHIRYSNDVYDMMGRMVRKNAESLDGLRKGVYIWKGEKKVVF